MADFELWMLNEAEPGVRALTERAQRRLPAGLITGFKSCYEAAQYVCDAELKGFTFTGRGVLDNLPPHSWR
jgi:hypothetical protein